MPHLPPPSHPFPIKKKGILLCICRLVGPLTKWCPSITKEHLGLGTSNLAWGSKRPEDDQKIVLWVFMSKVKVKFTLNVKMVSK
jgi:hypothetical protein